MKDIANHIHKDDTVDIRVVVSEEESVRKELKSYIENMVLEKEAKLEQCSVLCSYKQSLSWIMEEVVLKIKSFKDEIEGISIKFKPFLPKGKTKWDDEDGAIPKVTASRYENPNKFFDLPIRLVQELYTVDDLIEEEIGLNRNNVLFEILEDAKTDYKT